MADIEPYTVDLFTPMVEALGSAIGSAFGAIRAFMADTLGQFLVALYTPFYFFIDLTIALIQLLFGVCDMLFGWMPPQLFLGVLYAIIILSLNYILYLVFRVVRGA